MNLNPKNAQHLKNPQLFADQQPAPYKKTLTKMLDLTSKLPSLRSIQRTEVISLYNPVSRREVENGERFR